ncbi:MAG: hypothetical protein ACREH8_24590 [Opitutaceae bacterium]
MDEKPGVQALAPTAPDLPPVPGKHPTVARDYEYKRMGTASILAGRIHPVIKFLDADDRYICEVRYGDAKANALQRGLWTHTKNAVDYFTSVTDGWIDYSHNKVLVTMFSHAFLSRVDAHAKALEILKLDIDSQKRQASLGERKR